MAAPALNDLIDVAVPMPVYRTYTYRVPREFDGTVEIGMRVEAILARHARIQPPPALERTR